MAHNEEVFMVTENDETQEIFSVAEEEAMPLPQKRVEPVTPAPGDMSPQTPRQPQNGEEQKLDEQQGWRSTKDPKEFMEFLQKELRRIGNPHAWRTKSEKERGLAQLKKLDHFTSEALRSDYDNVLDVPSIDAIRNRIEHHIDQCEVALEGIQNMKKNRKKLRRRGEDEPEMTKEAGVPHFNGMNVMITPLERAIVGILINGKVSGGKDMEELYAELKEKYDLSERDDLAIFQILNDMGYPTFRDRLRLHDSEDPTREEGLGEWQQQFYA